MPETTTDRPLWRVMQDAYYSVQQHPDVLSEDCERQTIAAELRAIADWLVPDENPPWLVDPSDSPNSLVAITRYIDQQDIRAKLLAEADRAETGEVSFDTEDGVVVLKASQIEFIPPPDRAEADK